MVVFILVPRSSVFFGYSFPVQIKKRGALGTRMGSVCKKIPGMSNRMFGNQTQLNTNRLIGSGSRLVNKTQSNL